MCASGVIANIVERRHQPRRVGNRLDAVGGVVGVAGGPADKVGDRGLVAIRVELVLRAVAQRAGEGAVGVADQGGIIAVGTGVGHRLEPNIFLASGRPNP